MERRELKMAACWQEDSSDLDESSTADPPSDEPRLEPMDAGTYRLILKEQSRYYTRRLGRQASMKVEDLSFPDRLELKIEEIALIEDFVSNKVVWTGIYLHDLWLFLINVNPVIALFYSHPLHPILRRERIFVYALSIVFVTWVTMNITKSDRCHSCGLDTCRKDLLPRDAVGAIVWRPNMYIWELEENATFELPTLTCGPRCEPHCAGADEERWNEQKKWLPGFCCDAWFWGALWFYRTLGSTMGCCLYALITNCVFAIVCFQLLFCPCVQRRTWRCRRAGELTGSMCFILLAALLLWRCQDMMQYIWKTGDVSQMVWNWLKVKAIGSIGVTIWNVIVFSFIFQMQRPKEGGDGIFARLAPDPPARGEADTRGCLAKILSPQFCVGVSEYHRFPGAIRPQG